MLKRILLISNMIAIALLAGCSTTDNLTENTETYTSTKQEAELKKFIFTSPCEIENIEDEDLIYIAQNDYKTTDFFIDGDYLPIDYFGVELAKYNENDLHPNEVYETEHLHILEDTSDSIDLKQPISQERLQPMVNEHIQQTLEAGNTKKPGRETGRIVTKPEITFCGENISYTEYSIRYTVKSIMYKDNVLTTSEYPKALRHIYMKTILQTTCNDKSVTYLLGNLTKEYVCDQLDILITQDTNNTFHNIVYRYITENEEAYVYKFYTIYSIGGDYDINDTAVLACRTININKTTHEINWESEEHLKEIEIEGTAREQDY